MQGRGVAVRGWAIALLGCLAVLSSVVPAHADDLAFTVDDPAIAAPTGFALDVETGRYWMVRASGPGEVVALDDDGAVEGTAGFNAETQQVQALADDGDRLFIGDIGDVDLNRDHVTVYFLTTPEPGAGDGVYSAFDFVYPDGPHHAKAMFVRSGRIYLVTSGADPGVYAAPQEPDRMAVNTLERLGDAPANVTDAVVLGDGRVVLRTYTSLHVLDGDGIEVGSSELPWQQQGEIIARDANDESNVLLGDSAQPIQVIQQVIPDSVQAVPEAPAEPPPPPGEGGGSEEPAAEEPARPSGAGAARTGTWIALGLAGLVALAAGVIVFRAKLPAGAAGRPRVTFTEPPPKKATRGAAESDKLGEQAPAPAPAPVTPATVPPVDQREVHTAPAPSPDRSDAPARSWVPQRSGPGVTSRRARTTFTEDDLDDSDVVQDQQPPWLRDRDESGPDRPRHGFPYSD